MKTIPGFCFLAGIAALALPSHADTFGTGMNQFSIGLVEVGDPGNPDDSGTTGGSFSPYGRVDYLFNMGVHEVSRDMIAKANTLGGLGITLADMSAYGGNSGARPATGVSWNEAARFVNWLNTSQGYPAAYKFSLQPGDAGYDPNQDILLWSPGEAGYHPGNLFRNARAHYVLPSEDEWYKAAYYSGVGTTYYDFATLQDLPDVPLSVAGGIDPGTAVYSRDESAPSNLGPADIDQAGGLSHYGTMGQNGNVWEWNESTRDGANNSPLADRIIRGGCWDEDEYSMWAEEHNDAAPTDEASWQLGFRVASVIPEPCSAALLAFGSAVFVLVSARVRERRRRAMHATKPLLVIAAGCIAVQYGGLAGAKAAVEVGVSNFGEGDAQGSLGIHAEQWLALSFTTGTGEFAWRLDSVEVRVYNMVDAAPDFHVCLYDDRDGFPGDKLLELPGPIPGGLSYYRYTPADTCVIVPNQTYWVSLETGIPQSAFPDIYGCDHVATTGESGLPGWTVGDGIVVSHDAGSSWYQVLGPPSYLQVNVERVPEPSTFTLLAVCAGVVALKAGAFSRRP